MSLVQELTPMTPDQLQRIHSAGKMAIYDSYTAAHVRKDSFRAKNILTPLQKSIVDYLNLVDAVRSCEIAKNTKVKSKSIWGMLDTLVARGKVFKRCVTVKGYKNPVMYYSTDKSNLNKLRDQK